MLSQNATTRNSLLQVSRVITIRNYEKHALRVSRVIAVLAKSACKHAIFLATRVKKRMCLGTFSHLRRLLATSTLYAAVCILAERFLLYRKAISCEVKNSVPPILSIDDTLFSFSGSAEPVHRINNLTDFRDFLMILFHEFFNFFLLF